VTFMFTTQYAASASLTFNGTAIWIFGARARNRGTYNVTLDETASTGDGFHDGQLFQQVLFSAVGLNGTTPHTILITNSPTNPTRPRLDVYSVRGFEDLRSESLNGIGNR